MCKLFIKKPIANLACVSLLMALIFPAQAQQSTSDVSQEIQINARHNSANLREKIASYRENVVITQGSIKITADEATVYSDLETDKKTYMLTGLPVKFERSERDGFVISAQANTMKYEPEKNLITIDGKALLQEKMSKVSGESILYNIETKDVLAKGSPVSFHRKLADGSPIDILGNDISYYPKTRVVSVTGNAAVRQTGTEVKGSKMTYNVDTEQLDVDSTQNETVTTIIQPKAKKVNK